MHLQLRRGCWQWGVRTVQMWARFGGGAYRTSSWNAFGVQRIKIEAVSKPWSPNNGWDGGVTF